MKDCLKVFIIKLLMKGLIVYLKLENPCLRFKLFFSKIRILRLKLINKRYNLKQFGGHFSVLNAIRESRNEINYIFSDTHNRFSSQLRVRNFIKSILSPKFPRPLRPE